MTKLATRKGEIEALEGFSIGAIPGTDHGFAVNQREESPNT